jgi:hypothetical protein
MSNIIQVNQTEWKVESFTKRNVTHTVDKFGNIFRCSCQDFRMNGNPNCKHIRVVYMRYGDNVISTTEGVK